VGEAARGEGMERGGGRETKGRVNVWGTFRREQSSVNQAPDRNCRYSHFQKKGGGSPLQKKGLGQGEVKRPGNRGSYNLDQSMAPQHWPDSASSPSDLSLKGNTIRSRPAFQRQDSKTIGGNQKRAD